MYGLMCFHPVISTQSMRQISISSLSLHSSAPPPSTINHCSDFSHHRRIVSGCYFTLYKWDHAACAPIWILLLHVTHGRPVPLSSTAVVEALGTSRCMAASPRIAAAAAGHVGCLWFCTVMSTTAVGIPAVWFWAHTDAFPFGVYRGVELVGEKACMCSVLVAPTDCPAFGHVTPSAAASECSSSSVVTNVS